MAGLSVTTSVTVNGMGKIPMGDSRKMKYISVVRDFSDEPYGRFPEDGEDDNGQKFRDELLIPALRQYDKVTVDLRGAFYGSSFLEETFGGLVRRGFKYDDLENKLIIQHNLEIYIQNSWKYIKDATKASTGID